MYTDANFPPLAEFYQSVTEGFAASGKLALSPATGALFPEVPADNSPISTFAVFCDDAAWPRSPLRYQRDVAADRIAYPAVGGMAANMWACGAWPFLPRESPVPINARGAANVLLVQGLRDPATPYDGATALRSAFGDRARLVSVDVGGHAVAYGINQNVNRCADEQVTAFLLSGQLPAADRSCAAEFAPPEDRTLTARPAVDGALKDLRRSMRRGI